MISCLDVAPQVLTLTTLGTPHRGTSFADWGVNRFARLAQPLLNLIGMPFQAFHDLTRASCQTFNATVLDVPTVRYFSVAGKHDGSFLHPEWLLSAAIVGKQEGDNDGVVSLSGHLPTGADRQKAYDDAAKVPGVKSVVNHIDVP